ncbi:hypothetical protein JTB14_037957 [Gonioctena quinquepunctata]|nr:hypothetical protein JTB14_037957 [Gonioctena quinquepunctata]
MHNRGIIILSGYNSLSGERFYWDSKDDMQNKMAKKDFAKAGKNGDYISIIERTNEIMFTRWVDNSVVTIASNSFGISPMSKVKRYSRKDKKHIQVSRPFAIGEYNSGMGGTDSMDGGVNCYRIGIRS